MHLGVTEQYERPRIAADNTATARRIFAGHSGHFRNLYYRQE